MKCGFCGRTLPPPDKLRQKPCGACLGGCRKIHCPWCGYENPMVPGLLRRWRKKDNSKEND
ncbi:hypothetical protein Pcar_3335 [Syntrophotalea carbinolica DSM 2380]|uniref:DNA helicase PriA n=1 Tax=Syntrophotalea carbinolica (strain DSM 2380 / NBRC 103641 / GraBd1) TaxID=338963 RepID=Q0C6I7_SYNC1|nr:hypothetical protein [Syntrophotalea carbinolica]ABI81951.2 hypothetical protein Pcar_3335 [Syntrophotalea carbinolica DSM 2380]